MEILAEHIEKNNELVNAIRFMIADNMFNEEFLLTAILEYLANNNKHEKEVEEKLKDIRPIK
jgi:hypothetical protein